MKTHPRFIVFLAPFLALLWAGSAHAIPAFARKYETNCSSCHTAWPMLNAAGREFKENGYKFPAKDKERAQVISDFLYLDRSFPASAVLVARPYDKKDSGDTMLRALHEVELMAAGVLYKNVSGFLELEAEDEENFGTAIPSAVIGWHPTTAVNVQFSWGPLTWADPYDTFSDTRRLTRGSYSIIDQRFGGADNNGRLRDSRQTVALYGRPVDSLFYSVGVSAVATANEGQEPKNYHARLAFDATPDVMVGVFLMNGTCAVLTVPADRPNCLTADRDFSRTGVDLQADIGAARVMAALLKAKDDNASATTEAKNGAWYLQALYVVADKDRKPTWVPLVRYDSYEKSNGAQEFNELTLNVGYYFTQNMKGMIEYWDQVDVPSGTTADKRFTLQLAVGF